VGLLDLLIFLTVIKIIKKYFTGSWYQGMPGEDLSEAIIAMQDSGIQNSR